MRGRNNGFWSVILLLTVVAGAAADWQFLPATRGHVRTLAADPTGQRLVLATPCGLERSTDGGLSWQPLSHPARPGEPWAPEQPGYSLPHSVTVNALDANGDTLLIDDALSVDGGATWRLLPKHPGPFRDVAPWRVQHDVWLGFTGTEFYISHDRGASWDRDTLNTGTWVEGLFQDPAADSTLWAWGEVNPWRGGAGPVLKRSTNLGATWTTHLTQTSDGHAIYIWSFLGMARDRAGTLLLAGYAQPSTPPMDAFVRLLASTDNGATWQERYHFPDGTTAGKLTHDAATGDLYWCLTSPGAFLRSTDNGWNWQTVSTRAFDFIQQQPQTGILLGSAGSPYTLTDPAGLWQSSDRGVSWRLLNSPLCGGRGDFAVFDETVVLNAGWETRTVYRLDDGAAAWQALGPVPAIDNPWEQPLVCSVAGDSVTAILVGDTTFQTVISDNGGQTWQRGAIWPYKLSNPSLQAGSDRPLLVAWIDRSPPRRMLLSADRGATWHERAPYAGMGVLAAVQTPTTLYVTTAAPAGSPRFLRTTDAGLSWEPLPAPNPLGGTLLAMGEDLLLVSNNHPLQHFANGVWDERGELPAALTAYVNGSSLWTLLPMAAETPLLVGLRADSSALWISRDGGMSWETRPCAAPYPLYDAFTPASPQYDARRQRLWVNTYRGPCYLQLAELTAGTEPLRFHTADEYALLSCYPNPFNNTTRIRYDLPQPGRVELTLYDLQGRLIQTLVDEIASAGAHETKIDGRNLASGTYFVKLRAAATARTQKLLLLK